MKRFFAYTLIPLLMLACAGPQIIEDDEEEIETKTYDLKLSEPSDGAVWSLEADGTYTFAWEAVSG